MFYDFPFLLYHYRLGDDRDSDDDEAPDDDDNDDNDELSDNNQMMSDMMSSASDFCPVGPTPAIMFGLREVITLMIMMSLIIMMMMIRSLCWVLTQSALMTPWVMTPGPRWWWGQSTSPSTTPGPLCRV